ncbi:MAG: hypothetical protein ACOYL6_00890 [Bacteriovoracaceae bacterium]
MSQNPFKLGDWFKEDAPLKNSPQGKREKRIASFTDIELKRALEKSTVSSELFDPSQYFIPGWKGESLLSKQSLEFNTLLDEIKNDCHTQFFNQSFTKALKIALHQEFLAYAEHKCLGFEGMDDYAVFWKHLSLSDSPHRIELDSFLTLYTYRVAIIYFHKTRFITLLAGKLNMLLADRDLLNPNSFLTNIFKSGSSTELKGHALLSNHYTWYRPSPQMTNQLRELMAVAKNITIAEIVKNVSQKTEQFLNETRYYSHALSHKHFGLFLNSLLLNFPIWLHQVQNKVKSGTPQLSMDTVCCKYTGDFLESLSLSHWLAQENNTYLKWDEILCPSFKGSNFVTGTYLKLCNELQFLSFVSSIADEQGFEPVSFIVDIMKNKYLSKEQTHQTMLLPLEETRYDRIILNMVDFPKNNAHYHLVAQIEKEGSFLKEEGFLFVLSTQKLFVPSLKDKVEALLKDYTLETSINMDELLGRGEVAPYLYIFSKPKKKLSGQAHKKRQMLSFRIMGELQTFQQFTQVTDTLNSFYLEHLTDTPPLFHKEIESGLRFEFYQDAIVEGRLINSSSKDSTKITHPNFFRNLTNTCVGLDNFFSIKPVNAHFFEKSEKEDKLGIEVKFADTFLYLMIIDQRNPGQTKLELTTFETFKHKMAEYGTGLCHYYGLTPKIAHINLNLFRFYFESSLGSQMIDLTFRGSASRFKAKLEGLFIPRFFKESQELPAHLESCLALFKMTAKELSELPPIDLKSKFNILEPVAAKMLVTYPYKSFGLSLYFLHHLEILLEGSQSGKEEMDFNHKTLQLELSKLPTRALYPHNEDLFMDFKIQSEEELHLTYTRAVKKSQSLKGNLVYSLELYHENQLIVEIFGEQYTIEFVQYLLGYVTDVEFTRLLVGLYLPEATKLKETVEKFVSQKQEYKNLHHKLTHLLSQTLIVGISGKK